MSSTSGAPAGGASAGGASVSEALASWAIGLRAGDIPAEVRRAACYHLLDGLGVAVAARLAGDGRPAIDVASALGGPPEAAVLGSPALVTAPAAALANGALVHAWDFDDTHAGGLVHATAVVLPAMLAAGQQHEASGARALAAAVAGYEAVCRIAAASPHGFHARGLHATAVCGVFSAALIGAKLAGGGARTAAAALGIAGSAAGGLLAFLDDGSSTKQLHPGMASMNGLLAARLAAAGASGPARVFEGPRGLFAALSARPAQPASITERLGQRWETTSIGYKPYPSCHLMHVTLDAVRAVRDQVGDPGDVREVIAHVHPDSAPTVSEPAGAKADPRTPYDAKFSLPWSVAALLTDGDVDAATYTPDSIARPAVAALARRVRTVLTSGDGPALDAGGHVELRLGDGTRLTGEVAHSRGSTAVPMTEAEIMSKFLANCGGGPRAADLAARVLDLESAPGLHVLTEAARAIVEAAP